MASNLTGWGRFRVKLGNCIDRNLAKNLSTYFEFDYADVGKLSEASDPGHEIVRLLNSKNVIKAGDISSLLNALTDIEQERIAKRISQLHEEIMGRQSRPTCTSVKERTGRSEEYSLRVHRGLRPSESRELRNIVVVGKTGAGKSSTVNLLLGREVVKAKSGPNPVTIWSSSATCKYKDSTIAVADTPGIGDKTQNPKEVMKQLARVAFLLRDGIHCYVICLNASEHRFTDNTREMLEKIETMGDESVYGWCMVLYTRAEAEFTHQSLDDYLGEQKKHKYLQTFFEALEDRVVAVNTKTTDQTEKEQNRECIIAMVDKVIENNEKKNRTVLNGSKLFRNAKEAYEAVVSEIPPGGLNPVLISAIIETMIEGSVSENTSENRFTQSVFNLITQSETCSATQSMLIFNFDEDEYRISHAELKSQVKQIFEKIKEKESVFKKALRKAYKKFCLRSEVE